MYNLTKTEAALKISNFLTDNINKNILLLLSGGSSADIGVRALQNLPIELSQKITVAMVDERVVKYNSEDSNAKKLKDLGILNYINNFIEIINESNSKSIEITKNYQNKIEQALENTDFVIALVGIGLDNHTAGLLPGYDFSDIKNLVINYKTDIYERISISPYFFTKINQIFVYVEGEDKEAVVNNLLAEHDSVKFPSQLIKKARNYQILYNKEIKE